MKKLSSKEKEIADILNNKRNKAYIDIYKETDFSGIGLLIDENLDLYKYCWHMAFNNKTNSFDINHYLYKFNEKIDYDELENFLIKDLNIIEKSYDEDDNIMEKSMEVIKLKVYEKEFSNIDLYDKIKEKINIMIEEDL